MAAVGRFEPALETALSGLAISVMLVDVNTLQIAKFEPAMYEVVGNFAPATRGT